MPFTGGNEVRVNQETNLTQTTSITNNLIDNVVSERQMQSLAMDANGNLVVTWSSLGQDVPAEVDYYGVYARRYDAATSQWGSEFLVNRDLPAADDQRSGNQLASAVAIDDEGNFIITWSDDSAYQDDQSDFGIYAQRYNKDGSLAGSVFRVNTTTNFNQSDASVAVDADGDFVVTWTSQNQDVSGTRGIFARRYSKDGTPLTGELAVNTYTTNDQTHSSVAMDANGNFVVVWESNGQDGESWGIYGQRFSADGNKLGGEFAINVSTARDQRYANVSTDATGNFVVTWTSNQGAVDGAEIFARRYGKNGTALGNEFKVNQSSAGSQQYSSVKMLKTGGFIITWTGADASGTGISGRRFGANGLPLAGADGNEFLINKTEAGKQNLSTVGVDANGNFAVSWTGDQDGTEDVYSRIFSVPVSTNQPPTDIKLSNDTIIENVADNTLVGTFSTVDPDVSDTVFVYDFAVGAGDTDNSAFAIVNNNGIYELRIRNSPNFEAKDTYSIRVSTTDPGGLSYEETLTIKITNANEQPTDISIDNSTVNENVAVGTSVGNFSTVDPDANNTFVYTLVAGAGSTDNSLFAISGNNLKINASPDYETKSNYSIRVRSTDQNGLFTEKTLTIGVNDVNEKPIDVKLSKDNINENVPANSTIGTLSTVDPDAGDTFTYGFAGGVDDSAFTIFDNNGIYELRINNSPDYETKSTYSILVRTTDKAGLFFDKTLTIKINDLNDPPANKTPTDLNLSATSVNEGAPAGVIVGILSTADPNAGDTFNYELVSGVGSTDNGTFTIVNNSGVYELHLISSPDFETKGTYSVRIRTIDQGGLNFEKPFTITVVDKNEAPTDVFIDPDDNVDENVVPGSLVGNLSTVDPDNSDPDKNDTFTYEFITGVGSTDNGAFSLSPSGALTINASPNFEAKSEYAIRVKVTDAGGNSIEKALTIYINDIAEAGSPTDLTVDPSEIDENSPANSVVGTLNTTDNTSGPFTYTLDTSFGDGAEFTIDASNQLVLKSVPNFEVKPRYNVRIKTTDPDSLSLTKVLTVTVKDINENPTDITLSATSIDENKPADSVVGTFKTADPDATDTFTYELVPGVGSTDNTAFTIANNNGISELRLINSPNYETKPDYAIRVRTTDKGGLVTEKAFTITVNNVGETPIDITLSPTAIDENKPANSVVGNFTTTDGDANETFTYSLVTGTGDTDNVAFTIVGNQLQIKNPANFETKKSYSIRVRTTDKDKLFTEKTFIIDVNDVNETPLDLTLSATSIDENKPANSIVGNFNTIDSDANETFTYALVAGTGSTDNGAFTIVNNNGIYELHINNSPDYEARSNYSIRVRTTDSKGLFIEKPFTITVNNLAELPGSNDPRDITLSSNSIDENKPPNTIVGTFTTIDPDQGDTFTYELADGVGSTDNADFTIVNNDLRIKNYPDAETKSNYSIRVKTTDQGGRTFEKTFTINVKDLPETPGTTDPRDIQLDPNQVIENNPANTAIGTLSTVDPDNGDTFTYQLVLGVGSTDNAKFTIVGNQLRINESADYEKKNTYSIRVKTTDQGKRSFEKVLTVNVTDSPELPGSTDPRDITLSNNSIDENKPPNTIVGTFDTVDPDQGDTFTYALVDGVGSTDNDAFTIVNNNGIYDLRIKDYPDFETKPNYSIRIKTTDQGNRSFEKVFTINVKDLPETPGTTDPRAIELKPSEVAENNAANTVIGTLSTVDPDKGDTFTYQLVSGLGDKDNAAFTLVGDQLRINDSTDYETKATYTVRVRTTDKGNRSFEQVLTISVTDLPETPGTTDPRDITLSKTSIDENVPADTEVGAFSTVDPDQGDTFTYSLVPNFGDNAAFRIVGDKLRINASPDFEAKPSYSIRVTTTDSGGRTFTKTLTLTVNNLNDAPVITTSVDAISYKEASPPVVIDPGVSITDIDSTELVGAVVRIANYVPGQDVLALSNQAGITANFNSGNGTLTLTGTATLAAYQQALRSITYSNSSTNPNTATRTIQFTVRDSFSESRVASRAIQITSVDTAPIVTTSSGNLAYTENAGEVIIDAAIIVSDEDSPTLTGATVKLVSYVRGQDQLRVTTPTGISSNFDSATGTLTLAGNASPDDYQRALRSVTYLNTSSNPSTAPRTVQFSVRDTAATSKIATRTIQVTPVDSAPAITTSEGDLSYKENSDQVAIDPQLTVVDPDSQMLTGATVSLQGYQAGQDRLSVVASNGIVSNFDTAKGVLTLTGTASVATYQAVLRSVRYFNNSDNPSTTVRTAQFSVRGALTSNVATRAIQIIPVNDAPKLQTSIKQITFSNGSVLIDSQIAVSDIDNAKLSGATIKIENYIAEEDNLLFQDQNGITGNFDPVAGVLQLTGSADVAFYQAALRSIQYANSSAIATATPRILNIQITDGVASSDLSTGRIKVEFSPSGTVPTIDLNGSGVGVDYSNTFVVSSVPVAIVASDATFTNESYPVLTSAEVVISNLLNGANEKLIANTTGTRIAASYDAAKGVLTLTGRASLADYLQVLRSVQYENRSPAIDTTTRTILFRVSNGSNSSEPAQTRVQISQIKIENGTLGADGSLITTPATDLINAYASDDSVVSILANLQQNDTINGGAGKDTFTLLDGNGTATIDVENSINQVSGILTNNTIITGFEVFKLTGFAGSATLIGSDWRNDTLYSGSGNDVILGKAGNDTLAGSGGNDQLNGGLGDDQLNGGTGNDLYIVDSVNDFVIEELNAGYDTVQSSVNFTLSSNVEALMLTDGATVGIGNLLDNLITGNVSRNKLIGAAGNDLLVGGDGKDELISGNGNDRLMGEQGRDKLIGGKGKDIFVLSKARKSSMDTIKDFRSIDDTIEIARSGFSRKLKLGKLRVSQFQLGASAQDASDRFIYNRSIGALFFDADGLGGTSQVQVARLGNKASLNRSDIVIVGF